MNEGDEEDLDDVKPIAKGIGTLGRPVPVHIPSLSRSTSSTARSS